VEFVITDSPLILNSIYYDYYLDRLAPDEIKFTPDYIQQSRDFFDSTFAQFNNINFFVERSHDFEQNGRNQTPGEAINIDAQIKQKLVHYDPKYTTCFGDTGSVAQSIAEFLIKKTKKR
jgi:hypothetical protein